jgi:phage-related protein
VREIHFYRTEAGRCPVEEFLDSLSGRQAQKVTWVLRLIEELDTVPAQYFKKLTDTNDLWEVRVQSGNEIFRLLGFLDKDSSVVLNHAFQKKAQKTPPMEIKIAEERMQDYLRRRLRK